MAEFPRYPLSKEQAQPVAPNIRELNAPYEAGQAALDVAQKAVNLGAAYVGKLADEAAKAEKLVVAGRMDQARAQLIDELGVKTEALRKSGNYSELRDKWLSDGGELNKLIDAYASKFKPGVEQETARAEFMQAGAGMFPQMLADARDSARAIDRANLNLSLRDDLASVASARGEGIVDALVMARGLSDARYEASVAGGSLSQQDAEADRLKFHGELSREAFQSALATAEDIFTRSGGSFGLTKAELERQKAALIPLFDKVIGNDLERALDDQIQKYDERARATADARQARATNRVLKAIRADGGSMVKYAGNGDRENFQRVSSALKTQYEAELVKYEKAKAEGKAFDPAALNELAEWASPEAIKMQTERLDRTAIPREWANEAVTRKPVVPLPATPDNAKIVDTVYSTRMASLANSPLTERLGYTNAVINNSGMVTRSMVAQYDYAFQQVGTNPAYAPVLVDALDDLENMSAYSYGEFIKTQTGQQAAMFKAQYESELAAARATPGAVPNLAAITSAAYKAASTPADNVVLNDRRKFMAGEGLDILGELASTELAEMLSDKLGGASGFDADDFEANKNSGISGEVYKRIIQKAQEYYVFATGGMDKKQKKNIEKALDLAASDVLTDYQWSGTDFKRGSPLSMGAGPGDNPRIYADIHDKALSFDAIDPDDDIRQAQYLGGVSGGWILYMDNNVVTNKKGEVFVYKPGLKK